MTFVKNDIIYNELYFVIFIITLILLAILKSKYGELSKQLVFSIFDKKNSDKFLKRDNVFSERINYIFNIILVNNFSLVLLVFTEDLSYSNYFKILTLALIFFSSKYLLIVFLCEVFNITELKRFSLFHTFLYEKIYSVVVTPILIIYFFSSISYNYYLINFFMILLILTILLKLKNVFNLLMNTVGIKTFHIILYLCISEIIPISLIAKGIFY